MIKVSTKVDNPTRFLAPSDPKTGHKMPEAVKYERIQSAESDVHSAELNAESSPDSTPDSPSTLIAMPNQQFRLSVAQTTAATLILILFYFCLSIGLTFYQRWLLKVN